MKIEVGPGKYGRGVFAKEFIEKGSIVEIAPVLILPSNNHDNQLEDQLQRFQFDWVNGLRCIALGYGSIYNHDDDPTVIVLPDYEDKTIYYIALRDIQVGEEIFINYGYTPKDNAPIEGIIASLSIQNSLSKFIIESTINQLKIKD